MKTTKPSFRIFENDDTVKENLEILKSLKSKIKTDSMTVSRLLTEAKIIDRSGNLTKAYACK